MHLHLTRALAPRATPMHPPPCILPSPTHFRFQVRRAFYWYDDGLAYNYTLMSLHRKLHNLWGQHF